VNLPPRFKSAAHRVLQGDESREAARHLEGVVLDDYPADERLEDLLYVLSMYSPDAGAPYCDAKELREAVEGALNTLHGSHGFGER